MRRGARFDLITFEIIVWASAFNFRVLKAAAEVIVGTSRHVDEVRATVDATIDPGSCPIHGARPINKGLIVSKAPDRQ